MNPHKIIVGRAIELDVKQTDAYTYGMPKRTSKKQPSDINVLAASIVRTATRRKSLVSTSVHEAAVALGRLGGLKGGKARAEKLTPKERSKIARKAARVRWKEAEK